MKHKVNDTLGRVLACALTVVLAASLSACSKGESDPGGDSGTDDGVYTVQVLVPAGAAYPTKSSETEVGKYILDTFGVDFEYIQYAGDMREKQSLMLASNDYGEMQQMQRQDIVKSYINAGKLIELDPYLEDMPEFTARFVKNIPYWRLNSDDGKLYNWELEIPSESLDICDLLVRSDLLEEANWELPLTTDEWIDFLREAKENHPTTESGQATVGMTMPGAESYGVQGILPILYEKGDTYLPISNDSYTFNVKTRKFEDYFKNPEVKESFQFFNRLYREGLLDEECFTDTNDRTIEKAQQGVPLSIWYVSFDSAQINEGLVSNGLSDLQYVQVPIQSTSQVAAGQKRMLREEVSRPYASWGLTDKCKQPEKLLEIIEWASSDEGQIMMRSGFEGEHYTVEDGKRVPTDALLKAGTDSVAFMKETGVCVSSTASILAGLPIFQTRAADGQFHGLLYEPVYKDEATLTDRQKEVYQNLGWESSQAWWEQNGTLVSAGAASSVSIDPTSDLGKTAAKMVEVRTKWSARMVLAESEQEFEQVYSDAMAEYDKLDHQSVIDELNRLYSEIPEELR